MFATEYEALGTTVRDEWSVPAGSALYALWRSKGSWALLLRSLVAQLTMTGVLVLFYVLAVATDYLAPYHPLCPPTPVLHFTAPNQATVFETDCWGERRIDLGRSPPGWVVFVLASAATCMAVEAGMCLAAWLRLRRTEAWWYNHREEREPQPMREIDWEAVHELVHGLMDADDRDLFVRSVTRRSDAFVRLYNGPLKHLCCIPRTLHGAINAAALLHRGTGWSAETCFRAVAVAAALGSPYLLVATLCQFVFRNGAVLRGGSAGVGTLLSKRRWSRKALWTMRNEGEPSHRFEERMEAATGPAFRVLEAMPVPHWVRTLATMVLVLSASFAAAVLFVTLVVDDLLFSVYLTPGRTAGFYAGLAGVVMALAGPLAAKPRPAAFDKELAALHEAAPKLLEQASTIDDQAQMVDASMQYWGQEFLIELSSLFTTPWTLWWLPADQVVRALR